jgi:hypothetical protein
LWHITGGYLHSLLTLRPTVNVILVSGL